MSMTIVLASWLQGCAALPLAAVGSIVASGAGAIVKTGTEYTFTGTAQRTLSVPIGAVRAGILEAFNRTGVEVVPDKGDPDELHGKLQHRTVKVRLTAFSHSLTGVSLTVTRTVLKDRATASELLEQLEQVLAENPAFARRLHRVPTPDVAASPAHY
jgi:hypothetical protein